MGKFIKIKASNNEVFLYNLAQIIKIAITEGADNDTIQIETISKTTCFIKSTGDEKRWDCLDACELDRVKDEILKACGYE